MAPFNLRHLTTCFALAILTLIVTLSGCRTTSDRNSDIKSNAPQFPSDELESVTDFSDVAESVFNNLRENSEAEFLGCLCIVDATNRTQWAAWQFLKVDAKGYRTATDMKTYDDLEACVAMREILMECEG
jgi:hypothetical protein